MRHAPFLILFALLALSVTAHAADPPQHPNILFIIPDQWRAFATGYAGDPNVKTPNLDRLASQSIDFTHAVSTCPVCSPFRASLLTGQRATTHGIFLNDAHLADNAVTLGKVLSGAGYDTAWIGKWHVNGRGRLSFIPAENRQGFAYWKVCECTHTYNHSIYFGDTPDPLVWPGYDAFAQTDDAKQYIRDRAKTGKPFALFLAWGPPHDPYGTAPPEFKALYRPGDIKLRGNVPDEKSASSQKELASYYAHCSALDKCVGELWQTLRDAGIEKNTIVVFTSDHGDMLGSHGLEKKQKPWDEAVRVPMLWHYPALLGEAGKRVDGMISSEDLMPTLLGLCNVLIPPGAEGVNFADYLQGGKNPKPDNAALIECIAPFGEWNRTNGGREFRGVRTERYTFVRDLNGPWLMYDNETDRWQNENLADKPDAAALRARLDAILQSHLKSAGDEFLPADKYLAKWGYADRVDKTGTLPTKP